jgi:hypothetical protein
VVGTGPGAGNEPAGSPDLHLLSNPEDRYADLGVGYYQGRPDTDRKIRNHIRRIQALGFDVTITKAG